jgi:type I site-specific restriction endonuclease
LVDRDSLAVQTVGKFKVHLGDHFKIERAVGSKDDKHQDILVSTVQHLAARNKYQGSKDDNIAKSLAA